MFALSIADKHQALEKRAPAGTGDPRELPFVKAALASIKEGGYTEAFARVAFLVSRKDDDLPLSRLVMRQDLLKDYGSLVPAVQPDEWRRIRGEQEIIAQYEPDQAIATLPNLLSGRADRERMLTAFDRLLADERVQRSKPTAGQKAMIERIRAVLRERPGKPRLAVA